MPRLRCAAAAYEMNYEENQREHKQDVNKEGCNVEDDECPNPREKHQERERQEYKAHEKSSERRG